MKIFVLMITLSAVLLAGCEKKITFDLKESEPKLVVEAVIENNQFPIVILSKSLNYFSSIDLNTLSNSFVHNADVFIVDGLKTAKLKEYAVPVGNGYNVYYYGVDHAATVVQGNLNRSYKLQIFSEGKEYNATTTIPNITKRIDSIYWRQAPAGNPPEKAMLVVKATDPPGFGDYIRYFTKQNSDPFYPGLTSVYDDQLVDGTTYEVQIERGVDRNIDHPEGYTFFNKGDTVTLKLCNIDKATFDFWRTMEFSYASIGNPFSTPTKILSNISGGALGYFGGYAVQFHRYIIPK
jgi:hypothetical protein